MTTISGLRKTIHIRSRLASRFFKGAKHSEGQARRLNLMVTLNLSHTACSPQEASLVMGEVIAKFGRWLRYQSDKAKKMGGESYGAPIYQNVIENPGGIHHAHWMVHVPDEVRGIFEKRLPRWVEKASGGIIRPEGAIDIKKIDAVMSLSRYLMKGVVPSHARRCFVKPIPQGDVWGKRVAISRSLGPTARSRAATLADARLAHRPDATGSASPSGSAAVPDP